jgi:hypothetical protein
MSRRQCHSERSEESRSGSFHHKKSGIPRYARNDTGLELEGYRPPGLSDGRAWYTDSLGLASKSIQGGP